MRDAIDLALAGLPLIEAGVVGVGLDVEDVARWEDPALRLDVLFNQEEIDYAGVGTDRARRLAGTWCAKEAVVKAVAPSAAPSLRDVRIIRDAAGAPHAAFAEAWRWLDEVVLVSISHTPRSAAAVALLIDPHRPEPTR